MGFFPHKYRHDTSVKCQENIKARQKKKPKRNGLVEQKRSEKQWLCVGVHVRVHP